MLSSKRILLFIIFVIGVRSTVLCGQDLRAEDITGTWLTEDKTGEIAIYKSRTAYHGKIVAGTSEQKFDVHNPDKARRNNPLIGLVILKDLVFDSDGQVWKSGTVYDPQNGKHYSCNVKLVDSNTLKITGYIGFSWIGRSELWTRIKN